MTLVLGEWDDILQAGAPFSIAWHLQAYRNSSPSNNYLSRGTKFRWVTSMVRQLKTLRKMTLVATSSACRQGLALCRSGRQNFHTSYKSNYSKEPDPYERCYGCSHGDASSVISDLSS
ncbi:unnamed protein product [Darwinula stevensoni]|uniref:Uncharacterized protein n=1 Tax=Darwinula stevensoni TaxID=69355 RepID=A0A7R9AH56_9CRUS|nr:unnamed protein product [Darwinula stevensoni]CAG0905276.1 unnamed protein product [Darwinula stevensoni]